MQPLYEHIRASLSEPYGHNYNIKLLYYTCFQCQINHTPCTVHIDHIASIEVRGMAHVTDMFKV